MPIQAKQPPLPEASPSSASPSSGTAPFRRALAGGLALLLLLAATPLLLPGCGEEEPIVTEPPPPEKSPQEIAAERERIRLDKLREGFAKAQRYIEEDPTAYVDHLQNLEGMVLAVEGTPLAQPVAQAIAQVKQMRETAARERLDAILPEVDRLVAKGEYEEAEEALAQFDPAEILEETAARKEHDQKLDWVRRSQDAYTEHRRITDRARSLKNQGGLDDLAKAIGLLESFPDLYSDTPYHGEIRALIDEYFALFLEEKRAKTATEDVPWTDWSTESLVVKGRSVGDVVVWNEAGDEVTGNNATDGIAMIEIGEDDWTSYSIELEVKVPAGQPLNLGVTLSIPPRASKEKVYDVEGFELDSSDWVHLLIEYKEGHAHVQDLGTLEPLTEPYRPSRSLGRGGAAILLRPGQSVTLRKVRTKVLTKEPPPEAPGAGGGEKPAGDG